MDLTAQVNTSKAPSTKCESGVLREARSISKKICTELLTAASQGWLATGNLTKAKVIRYRTAAARVITVNLAKRREERHGQVTEGGKPVTEQASRPTSKKAR